MPITVYIHEKCTTCQKALQFLHQHNIAFTLRDITKTPPSLEELEAMLRYQGGDIKKLCNTSGIAYRQEKISEKLANLTLPAALALLGSNGMLIKRPFVIAATHGLTGFKESAWLTLAT